MNQFVDLIPVNQYEVDLFGCATGDGRNTWKGVVETSLALHTLKFVTTRLVSKKEKGGPFLKKSHQTRMFEREKHGTETSSSISNKDIEGDEKYYRLWDKIKALISKLVTLQGRVDALEEKGTHFLQKMEIEDDLLEHEAVAPSPKKMKSLILVRRMLPTIAHVHILVGRMPTDCYMSGIVHIKRWTVLIVRYI